MLDLSKNQIRSTGGRYFTRTAIEEFIAASEPFSTQSSIEFWQLSQERGIPKLEFGSISVRGLIDVALEGEKLDVTVVPFGAISSVHLERVGGVTTLSVYTSGDAPHIIYRTAAERSRENIATFASRLQAMLLDRAPR